MVVNPEQQPVPQVPTVKVRYEDPSVVKFLVENREFLESFSKTIRGWACLPNVATGELEWVDTQQPLMNKQGALWLMGRMLVATDKLASLTDQPLEYINPQLRVEFKEIKNQLCAHLPEYNMTGANAIYVMGLVRNVLWSTAHRPVGDKERKHIYGSIDESVNSRPPQGDKILGIIPRF